MLRFIPAYAGNSPNGESSSKGHSVHPRLRGELFLVSHLVTSTNGSSPLTRGTPGQLDKANAGFRFIPAYAGNSRLLARLLLRLTVHPRLRGELCRVRQGPHKSRRFIPAYAGNSLTAPRIFRFSTVHPRLRGELSGLHCLSLVFTGSSPLTRGTRNSPAPQSLPHRFIPAYAGNSSVSIQPRPSFSGSSPLTRGTQPPVLCLPRGVRFIPAYAGNSLKDGINPSIHTLGI